MKKFIDEKSGKIITVLNNDEAKKILEMYIEYCQGKREVKKGRLNLVNYLGDFVKYSNEKDMSKFYDILLKLKGNFEFSRNEQKAYDSLLSFFEIYNKIDKGEFEVSKVTSFITDTISKKKNIDEKILGNQELNFEEKINNIFFNENFDLSILAKNACNKWDELLKQKINDSNGEIEVSLKEEIAYQDLLALSNKEDILVSNKIIEDTEKDDENKEIINEQIPQDNIEDLSIDVDENNSQESEEKKEDKEDKDDKDEKIEEKNVTNEEEEIIGASTIRDMTEDVSLRDAVGTFNEAIDSVKENNNQNADSNNSNTLNSSTSYGTLRDM